MRKRKHAVATTLAGMILTAAASSPDPAHAMSVGAQLGVLSATAPAQVEQAGWCGRRGCLGRPYYQNPPPYAYYSYRPWPYYNYFFGSGWSSYGVYR
jgi:hypothetical protein